MSSIGDMPVIYIDQKKARIRIHRRTLHLLGNPRFIQLLVNPTDMTAAIRTAAHSDDMVHRVRGDLSGKQSYELYSRYLLQKLQGICSDWKNGESYKIMGEIVPSENMALFNLYKAIPYSCQREAGHE